MYKVFDHAIAVPELLATDELIGFMRLIDTAGTANQTIDADAVEQSCLGAETDVIADLIDRVYLACVGHDRRRGIGA